VIDLWPRATDRFQTPGGVARGVCTLYCEIGVCNAAFAGETERFPGRLFSYRRRLQELLFRTTAGRRVPEIHIIKRHQRTTLTVGGIRNYHKALHGDGEYADVRNGNERCCNTDAKSSDNLLCCGSAVERSDVRQRTDDNDTSFVGGTTICEQRNSVFQYTRLRVGTYRPVVAMSACVRTTTILID